MAVYNITYDLNNEISRRDHTSIRKAIQGFPSWRKICDSSYLVDTDMSAEEVFAILSPYVDHDDNVMVLPIYRPYAGRNHSEVLQWMEERVTARLMERSENPR